MKTKTLLMAALLVSGCISSEQESITTATTPITAQTTSTAIKENTTTTTTKTEISHSTTTLDKMVTTTLLIDSEIFVDSEVKLFFQGETNDELTTIILYKDQTGTPYNLNDNDEQKIDKFKNHKTINTPFSEKIIALLKTKGYTPKVISADGDWSYGKINKSTYGLAISLRGIDSIMSVRNKTFLNEWQRNPPFEVNLSYIQRCKVDTDCMFEITDCCASKANAINKQYSWYTDALIQRKCLTGACITIAYAYNKTVKCEDNLCRLT